MLDKKLFHNSAQIVGLYICQEGRGFNNKKNNESWKPQLAPALFSYLPDFYFKTGILNPSPFLTYVFNISDIYY